MLLAKSNRSRTGLFGVKNGVSEKEVKIEQVVFGCLFLQVVAGEWVVKMLCLTKSPVRTGPREGVRKGLRKVEQVTLTLPELFDRKMRTATWGGARDKFLQVHDLRRFFVA